MSNFNQAERKAMAILINRIESAMNLTHDPEVYALLSEALDAANKVNSTKEAKEFRHYLIHQYKKEA